MPRYQITLRVHDGWKYNLPQSYYTPRLSVISAKNRDEAYRKACLEASRDDKETVTVCRKDIVRIQGPAKQRYHVTLEFLYRTTVEVEAESADDARDAALSLPTEKIFRRRRDFSPYDLEDGQPIAVFDKDWNQIG